MGLRAWFGALVDWGRESPASKRKTMVDSALKHAAEARWHATEHREAMHYQLALRQLYLQRIERLIQDERQEMQGIAQEDAGAWDETHPSAHPAEEGTSTDGDGFVIVGGAGETHHAHHGDDRLYG